MTTISQTLNSLQNQCGLIPFITAGIPNLASTENALKLLDNSGADIIEIGLPYSDPLADGPIIQQASTKALQQGVTFDKLLHLLNNIHDKIKAPLILFTYYNPILARGIFRFLQDIADSGIKGLIIPDLPLEEADYVINVCSQLSLELILLVTPTSSVDRVNSIISKSQGLIYVVSSTGVTGLRENVKLEMKDFVRNIKSKTDKLLILGFGISQLRHVEQVARWDIDGVVIGSAFVKCLSDENHQEGLAKLEKFCCSVKETLIHRGISQLPPGEFESPLPP
uniref:Tryptophan synthase alpha chain n=1 Tax=Liagoropsis maxima TaxID=1653392 RepID=A0A1G4NVR9_9FLOR|nr:Tryptophan synthase alpha subunit [Liagoropsis maxima]SCW22725.1 Tryptophan synthase alpha subunit [Liagoropsis maxima]